MCRKDVVLGDAEKLRAHIPNMRTIVIDGDGVYVASEMPQAFANPIIEFLRKND